MSDTETLEKDWESYWKRVGPSLKVYLRSQRDVDVEKFLDKVLGLFSFMVEDLSTKVTANKTCHPKLDILLVVLHDILRGVNSCQSDLTLAPLALLARTSFEIFINIQFITRSSEPEKYADRLIRFVEIERLVQCRRSKNLTRLSQSEEQAILKRCPEWIDPKTKDIQKRIHWTAEPGMTVRKVAEAVNCSEYYPSLYGSMSIFVHGSPTALNLYRMGKSLRSVPQTKHCSRMALSAVYFCLEGLIAYCKFFGVAFPNAAYLKVSKEYLALSKR